MSAVEKAHLQAVWFIISCLITSIEQLKDSPVEKQLDDALAILKQARDKYMHDASWT